MDVTEETSVAAQKTQMKNNEPLSTAGFHSSHVCHEVERYQSRYHGLQGATLPTPDRAMVGFRRRQSTAQTPICCSTWVVNSSVERFGRSFLLSSSGVVAQVPLPLAEGSLTKFTNNRELVSRSASFPYTHTSRQRNANECSQTQDLYDAVKVAGRIWVR